MKQLIAKNRLLSAILLWALVTGTWEATHRGTAGQESNLGASMPLLGEVYPDEPRVKFTVGAEQIRNGDIPGALKNLRTSYEAGYKENEALYSLYIGALVETRAPREEIGEVVARWTRDYPASEKLAKTRERLRKGGVLP